MTEVNIYTERVDGVPLLIRQQQAMGISEVLDEVIVTHGNHQGLSIGRLTTGWLAYILSEADHRMNIVEGWARDRQETLSTLLEQPITEKDFSDDRLADILRYLDDDETWEEIERRLGRRVIRIYDLGRSLCGSIVQRQQSTMIQNEARCSNAGIARIIGLIWPSSR